MARNANKDPSITQSNRKQDFNTKNGKGRKAKTQSNKIDRQILRKDLFERLDNVC